jgi:hypothetical protein
MEISVRYIWLGGWGVLIILSLMALIDVSGQYRTAPCTGTMPILLSRAFTTRPWRGLVVISNFLAGFLSISINSLLITLAFLLFGCAFIISMFETPVTHDQLVLVGVALLLFEGFPHRESSNWWKLHWLTTAATGITCLSWMTLDDDDICSWWYITEYLFFWQLYLLVYWRIDPALMFTDTFRTPRQFANGEQPK